jgi:hypothetical protein
MNYKHIEESDRGLISGIVQAFEVYQSLGYNAV